ncbi:MAG: dihydrolipoamide acetyltransferase family protein [Flavobacteriales bacterium]
MAEVVRMPKLSDTMEEGVVAEWHKEVGDEVETGEVLAEIETDKATMEFESFQEGILLHKGLEKGEGAPVNSILAIFGEEGEYISGILEEEKKKEAEEKNDKKEESEEKEEPKDTPPPPEPKPEPSSESKNEAPPSPTPPQKGKPHPSPSTQSKTDGRIKASPLAKKLAEEKGLSLAAITGTGYEGRVVKRDIENYKEKAVQPDFVGEEKYKDVALSQMRKTIGKRLSESKFTAPHFYLTREINMERAIETRKAINKAIEPSKISFNDLIIKASAHALKENPEVNASFLDDRIRYYEHVNIGVAVAVEEGLLVPVIRFADGKPLTQINQQVREYSEKAKAKTLQPEEWEGSTFTISNLGMFGIDEFTAIINPPNACILAIGNINDVPVVKDDKVVPGKVMKVTLSCDHRVVDIWKTLFFFLESPIYSGCL